MAISLTLTELFNKLEQICEKNDERFFTITWIPGFEGDSSRYEVCLFLEKNHTKASVTYPHTLQVSRKQLSTALKYAIKKLLEAEDG